MVTVISKSNTLKEVNRTVILQALEGAAWMIGGPEGAAAKLGVKRTTLLYKMKKLGIFRPLQGGRDKAHVEALQQAESSAAV
jgi:transcriptional regulator with GAF, ATPase, and Fis domain